MGQVLSEFKFVKLKDSRLSADQAKKLSEDELYLIPEIITQPEDGKKQVQKYGEKLEQRYGNEKNRTIKSVNYFWALMKGAQSLYVERI